MLTNIFISKTKVNSLFRESSKSLIELATFSFFSFFDGKYCKQTDGVAMNFKMDSILVNVFLCHIDEQLVFDCPVNSKQISFRR